MAFDGLVISNLVYELNQTILNAKISKIAQPENDELLFTLKGSNGQFRLAMSASASLPFLYLTETNKPSPLTAPNFCMLLRKHIANGRIIKIYQLTWNVSFILISSTSMKWVICVRKH